MLFLLVGVPFSTFMRRAKYIAVYINTTTTTIDAVNASDRIVSLYKILNDKAQQLGGGMARKAVMAAQSTVTDCSAFHCLLHFVMAASASDESSNPWPEELELAHRHDCHT